MHSISSLRGIGSVLQHFLIFPFLLFSAFWAKAEDNNWPQFRGPRALGISQNPNCNPPVSWQEISKPHKGWRRAIPGLGHASPIIWEGHIYLATAVRPGGKQDLKVGIYGEGNSFQEKDEHEWRLVSLNLSDGALEWEKVIHKAIPRLERHTKATHCNSTPATDGKYIVAVLGSEGVFCYNMKGLLLWTKDLGKMDGGPYDAPSLQWGFASSPIIASDKVIVQCDVLSEQFLVVFRLKDGKELWRTKRKEVATWATPALGYQEDKAQVIVNGWKQIGGYDLDTGKLIWWLEGGGDMPVASPVVVDELVYLTSGHGKFRPMRAVRLNGSGNVTPPEMGNTNNSVIWCHPRQGNYLQTPIVVGELLWGCTNDGIVTCFDRKKGSIYYSERLGNGRQAFTASPVAGGGKVYFTGESGDVFVLAARSEFSVLATNKIDGTILATPAISKNTLFFRTTEAVVAVR